MRRPLQLNTKLFVTADSGRGVYWRDPSIYMLCRAVWWWRRYGGHEEETVKGTRLVRLAHPKGGDGGLDTKLNHWGSVGEDDGTCWKLGDINDGQAEGEVTVEFGERTSLIMG